MCHTQCSWGKETAKKARTQQHFESLENYIRALEAKVKDLQSSLDSCHQNHGGLSPAASSHTADDGSSASQPTEVRRTVSNATSSTDGEQSTYSSSHEES